ncbi:phage baseplate assembly protein [Collimonas sp. NPDC087041]|uniref:phage baseplate assembly protein n=1 Tax=Collimonas sp. NPDC087041 TaxID=3363960 RepID=UPI0037F3C921
METYTKDQAQVVVTVNNRDYQGWIESNIQRSIENISSRFTIPVSMVPGSPPDIHRQDDMKVYINKTLVVTGTVLAAEPFYKRDDCGFKIEGRSRTGDLIGCSAIYRGGQWKSAKLDQIARDVCGQFVDVVVDADMGAALSDFKIEDGETVVNLLSRAARMRGILVTTNARGQLLLTTAGKNRSHGAIVRGQNVISMESIGSDADRYSQYIGYGQKKSTGNFDEATQQKASVFDSEMRRSLPLMVNVQGNTDTADIRRLLEHTMRVRRGHAYGLKYQLEGWTWEGKPWEINTLVPIYDDIVGLNGDLWLICEINNKCDLTEGDVTIITVRPPDAYDSEPIKPIKAPKKTNSGGKNKKSQIVDSRFNLRTDI